MRVEEAYKCIKDASNCDYGRFFSPGDSLALGKGKVFDEILYPFFSNEDKVYMTVSGLVYVLTHECDVEALNQRIFNEDILISPIIPLESLIDAYLEQSTEENLKGFLSNLGARNISRLLYLPPINQSLPFGGVMFLNQISHSHVSVFDPANSKAAVTGYGLSIIEYILENHLLRPKADRLAFVPEDFNKG